MCHMASISSLVGTPVAVFTSRGMKGSMDLPSDPGPESERERERGWSIGGGGPVFGTGSPTLSSNEISQKGERKNLSSQWPSQWL